MSGGYKTDFNLNSIIATLIFSSVKNSQATVIEVSAAILNLVSFPLFDQCDCNKAGKIMHLGA